MSNYDEIKHYKEERNKELDKKQEEVRLYNEWYEQYENELKSGKEVQYLTFNQWKKINMSKKPESRQFICPECDHDAVALDGDSGNLVIWCINGHVCVFNSSFSKLHHKLIYNFNYGS